LTFGYNSSVQLTTITDALLRDTTLTYYPSGLVEYVYDPFGRSAHFEYDEDQNLTMVTDMGGYWSRFTYDADVYIASIENERGKWDFYIEPSDNSGANSDNYPPPGDLMWQNYRVTITNPLDGKEEFFFYGGSGGYSWYISSRDYIEWQSQTVNNFRVNVPRTYYYNYELNQKGKIWQISYPEGGYLQFIYDTQTGKRTRITDCHGDCAPGGSPISHSRNYTYNSNGLETSFTDARNKVTTTYYYPNNIDVQSIVNGLGTISFTYDGDAHKVRTITDRMGNVTQFDYNSYGQLRMITEAMGTSVEMATELVYNPINHNLTEVKRDGSALMSFTYDDIGRVETQTDATGLTLVYCPLINFT
jgi:YD repeat-containing protein